MPVLSHLRIAKKVRPCQGKTGLGGTEFIREKRNITLKT
jgi:hypothetical protein